MASHVVFCKKKTKPNESNNKDIMLIEKKLHMFLCVILSFLFSLTDIVHHRHVTNRIQRKRVLKTPQTYHITSGMIHGAEGVVVSFFMRLLLLLVSRLLRVDSRQWALPLYRICLTSQHRLASVSLVLLSSQVLVFVSDFLDPNVMVFRYRSVVFLQRGSFPSHVHQSGERRVTALD